jgi:alginate O-acetyltransferase complex protein AlgI
MTFDFYFDVKFWLFCAAAVVVYRLLARWKTIRSVFLLLCSSLMLLALPRFDLYSLGFVALLSTGVFFAGRAIQKRTEAGKQKARAAISVCGVVLVVAQLAFFKYRFIQDALTGGLLGRPDAAGEMLFVIGVSYFSFKMIHFIVESYKGGVASPTYPEFLNYILFFPSFTSGPIARFPAFRDGISNDAAPDLRGDLRNAGLRILNGLFKKLVLAMILYKYTFMNPDLDPAALPLWAAVAVTYASTVYFYLDFSAYSDLAIGAARALGITLPENFNNPFLKPNIQKLWAAWHMSLTQWLTDYIYWPLCRKLRRGSFFADHPVLLSNISITVTFIACGMWHGNTLAFLLWGLYHGIGLSILNVYQKLKRKTKSDFLRRYFGSKASYAIGVFATFNFFSFGMLFFFADTVTFDVIRAWF